MDIALIEEAEESSATAKARDKVLLSSRAID